MPLFEYRCESCGKRFEELVMNSREKVCCPDCESDDVVREISLFSGSASGCTPSGGGFG